MTDQRKLRFREWLTFGLLLAVLVVVFTLLPIPQGGQSEVIREQMYLLPIVSQPLNVSTAQPEYSPGNVEPSVTTEAVLSNEEISSLLVEAFGIRESVERTDESRDFSYRTPDALVVDDIDLGSLESVDEESPLAGRQNEVLDLRSNASLTQPLVPNLVKPNVSTDPSSDDAPRALDSARSTYVAPDLEVREETRPPPVTAEDFNEVVFEDSLAAWILDNPADLDPVVLSLAGSDDGVATARSHGRAGASTYELQMMLTPENGEVRIVLIEGTDLYFFVRPRVQRQASYFQKGTARRDAAAVVIAVESEDFSPEGDEAQTFYGLFLDWWSRQRK